MGVSVVIPTRNRDEDVKDLLQSILRQTMLPIEVIVVDDSDNLRTKVLVERLVKVFLDKGILLRYMRGKKENRSISAARNIGSKKSTGKIVLFLDDDALPSIDYVEKILEVYDEYPNAVGVQGYMTSSNRAHKISILGNAVNKVLFQPYVEKNSCRVHASGMSFPSPLTRIIRSQWLSGTNSSYKKEVLKNFEWDENLKGYSLCDDLDFSYRILRNHPNSLYTTPHARVVHKFSPVARINMGELIYRQVAYSTYFFFKDMKQTLTNMIIFFWGMFFGRFVSMLIEKDRRYILSLIQAYVTLIRNLHHIRNGNFASLQTMQKR
jgi:glycosyltransferase involved in cell wall biosynthesis